MTILQGGKTANRNGKSLELQIKALIENLGYYHLNPKEKKAFIRSDGDQTGLPAKWFSSQMRLESNLYGAKFTSDFVIYSKQKFPNLLHLEIKWQGTSGSVDEKYVFTALSLQGFSADTVMILAGGGARRCAVQWLKTQHGRNGFRFMNLDEFIHWANTNL